MADARRPPRSNRPSFLVGDFYGQAEPESRSMSNESHPSEQELAASAAAIAQERGSARDNSEPFFRGSASAPPSAITTSFRHASRAAFPPSAYPESGRSSPQSFNGNPQSRRQSLDIAETPRNRVMTNPSRNSSFSFAPPPAPWMRNNGDGSNTSIASTPGGTGTTTLKRRSYAPSTMLKGSIEKLWLNQSDKWGRVSWWITFLIFLIGCGGGGVFVFFGYQSVPTVGNLCLVLEDHFDTLDTNTWQREVQLGDFGNGQFEWTTANDANSFVDNGKLYIVPTLTEDVIGADAIFNGGNVRLTDCTAANSTSQLCRATSNSATGKVINPVQSARLTTKLSHSIQYGRVEIRAKLPKGDWLWPALWMLPVTDTYGPWPLSGEIDIMEARGNSPDYPRQGRNYVSAALNWGPTEELNSWFKTWGWRSERRTSFDQGFHTYTLEWTDKFLWVFVDKRVSRSIDLRFDKKSFFERGDFPKTIMNGTEEVVLKNPWAGRPNNAPFDQPFYLILNVAVGGTNGWFPDGEGGKPWIDKSSTAMRDFALAKDTWYPTWATDPKERGMAIDYVKMYQKC